MNPPAGWNFAVEIHPAHWRFPAADTWIAGWIRPAEGNTVTDVRAWLDQRPFLGLAGLPRPRGDEKSPEHSAPPYDGFSFLLNPPRRTTWLRLEACDLMGRWLEFYRVQITVAPDAPPPPVPARLSEMLAGLIPALLRRATRQPNRTLSHLAGETMAELLAEPLNAYPNPPFAGALEEPGVIGRVQHGRLSVTGWLAHRTARITRLTAIIDPLREVPLSYGFTRQDIAGNFPELSHQQDSAFSGLIDLPAGMNRPVLLKIFAELDTGEKHLAFAQRFRPGTPAGTVQSAPLVSGFYFARAVWSLVRAAQRAGIPTAGCFQAGRKAWAAYPARAGLSPASPPAVPSGNRPLRILVVTHNLNFEGAPRLVLELTVFLTRHPGISARLISPVDGPLRPLFESAGINVTVLDLAPVLSAVSAADFHARLDALGHVIDWSTVDLVLANTMVSFWAVHLAQRTGKPAVLYVHESAPVARFFAPLLHASLIPVIEEAFARAQRVVFTADASRQIFSSLDRHNNFRVLPSWLDVAGLRAFLAQHDKTAVRAKHGFDSASILLLNLGTVCERKGQHVFIQAAELLEPELRTKHPDRKIEFVMVGARDDPFLHSLEKRVAEARLQHIRFVPETRENYDFHLMADILVCTSFEESSPRVLLEAAIFGTPIVSTDVNGIPEMLTGREAWLVEPGDHYLLAAALRRALAAHFIGGTSQAERARTSVARRFDERISLPQHLELIREAAAIHPV